MSAGGVWQAGQGEQDSSCWELVIATSAGSAAARAGLATIVLLMLFTMKISKVLAEKTRKCWDLRAGGGKDW